MFAGFACGIMGVHHRKTGQTRTKLTKHHCKAQYNIMTLDSTNASMPAIIDYSFK